MKYRFTNSENITMADHLLHYNTRHDESMVIFIKHHFMEIR